LILLAVSSAAVAVRVWAPSLLEADSALAWLRGMSPLAQVGAYLVAYLVLTTLAVPAFLLAIVAGIGFGLPWGLVMAYLGANLASNLQFFIGRGLGAERIGTWLAQKGFDQRLDKNTVLAMLLLRAVPLPFLAANMGAGAWGVRWRTFLFGSGLGLIPQTTAFSLLAAQVHAGVEGAKTTAILWGVGGVSLLLGFTVISRRVLRNRAAPPP
jgi:uncharacterized membrane protein YdjX (TVP38/TMEM64 family)